MTETNVIAKKKREEPWREVWVIIRGVCKEESPRGSLSCAQGGAALPLRGPCQQRARRISTAATISCRAHSHFGNVSARSGCVRLRVRCSATQHGLHGIVELHWRSATMPDDIRASKHHCATQKAPRAVGSWHTDRRSAGGCLAKGKPPTNNCSTLVQASQASPKGQGAL